jgi:hypothetical protein
MTTFSKVTKRIWAMQKEIKRHAQESIIRKKKREEEKRKKENSLCLKKRKIERDDS